MRGYLLPHGAASEELPAGLHPLGSGYHTVDLEGTSYRVAVTVSDDWTLYMLHSRAQVEYRERRLTAVVLFGIVVTALLSAAGGWWLAGRVIAPVGELARRDLPYDLLIRPVHLPLLPELADRVPGLRMVIDHIAKPPIREQRLEGWAEGMERASAIPGLVVKLSGMITEADPEHWTGADLKPYVTHVLRTYGPDRVMFGSDWPVCRMAGNWKQALAAFTQALEQMSRQRWQDAEKGSPAYQPPYNDLKGGEAQFLIDYHDYYRTPRGYHARAVNSGNAWTQTTPLSFMNMPILTYIAEISPRPVML